MIVVAATAVAIDDPSADLAGLARVLSITGLLAAGVGVAGAFPAMGPVTAALLGAAYAVGRAGSGVALDPRLVPVAIALLAAAELVAWSAEERDARPPGVPAAIRAQRLVQSAAVGGAGALGVAGVVAAPAPNDLAVAAVGVAALALTAGWITVLTVPQQARGRPAQPSGPTSRELD